MNHYLLNKTIILSTNYSITLMAGKWRLAALKSFWQKEKWKSNTVKSQYDTQFLKE